MQPAASASELLGFFNCSRSANWDAVAAAYHGKPHALPHAHLQLTAQMEFKQPHEAIHFIGRTLPIVRGKSVDGEHGDIKRWRGGHDTAERPLTRVMTGQAWEPAALRPAPVAVHNNGDMK